MPNFVTLSCPYCGGPLETTADAGRLACPYCGKEQFAGQDLPNPVLLSVKQASDRVSDELALQAAVKERMAGETTLKAALQKIQHSRTTISINKMVGSSIVVLAIIVGISQYEVSVILAFGFVIIGLAILLQAIQWSGKLENEEDLAYAAFLELQQREEAIRAKLDRTA